MNDYPPMISDDEVARLPLHVGRADLLEDIMATPVTDRVEQRPTRSPRRPTPAWFAVPAAAAAIAAIALVPVVRNAFDGAPAPTVTAQPQAQPGTSSVGPYILLDAPGWKVKNVGESDGLIGVTFANGPQSLEIVQRPADLYDGYYRDRTHTSEPADTTLIGWPSSTFTYSAKNHATIRGVEGETFFEVRGQGMFLKEYDTLLAKLVFTDARGFADSVPRGSVTPFNRDESLTRLLKGVTVPDGFTASDVAIEGFNDAYGSAVAVAGSVGCAWLDVYAAGGQAAKQQTLAALDGSVDWPLLKDSAQVGDYPQVFWGMADELRAGKPVGDVRHGIC